MYAKITPHLYFHYWHHWSYTNVDFVSVPDNAVFIGRTHSNYTGFNSIRTNPPNQYADYPIWDYWLEIKGLQMRQFYWLWGMSSTEVLENIMAWRFSLKITICHGTKAASSNQQRSFIFHWKTTWNNFDEQVVVSCSSTRSSSSLPVNVQSPLRDKS